MFQRSANSANSGISSPASSATAPIRAGPATFGFGSAAGGEWTVSAAGGSGAGGGSGVRGRSGVGE